MKPFTLRALTLAASFAFAAPAQLKPTLKPADPAAKDPGTAN
jgi:hypothetical protein